MAASAGLAPGTIKRTEAVLGIVSDVTDVYGQTLSDVAQRIAQSVETEYAEAVTRAAEWWWCTPPGAVYWR